MLFLNEVVIFISLGD